MIRHLAVRVLFAAMFCGLGSLPAVAGSGNPVVVIKAYDLRGVDTGKCLTAATPFDDYRLIKCDFPSSANQQKFEFDPNGTGTWIFHFNWNKTGGLPEYVCMGVPGADTNAAAWQVGAVVKPAACGVYNAQVPRNVTWRWSNKQIVAVGSGQKLCLTAVAAKGPSLRLGDCTKPETLTAWDVLLVPGNKLPYGSFD